MTRRRTYRFSRATLWKMYWEQNLGLRQIAEQLGVSSSSVIGRAMKRFGIERKTPNWYTEARTCKECDRVPHGRGALCREHLREYMRERCRAWRLANPERHLANQRRFTERRRNGGDACGL